MRSPWRRWYQVRRIGCDSKILPGNEKHESEWLYYRDAFRGDELMKCLEVKKLKLAAGGMLRPKAINKKAIRYLFAQQAAVGSLQSRVEYYKRGED